MKKIIALIAAMMLALMMLAPAAAANPPGDKVGVCHRTASETNPYVYIEVPADEANGHITGTNSQHNHSVTWPTAGTWNGVAHAAGDERLDYFANAEDAQTNCAERTPPPPVKQEITPAAPTFTDPCGTENDEWRAPESDQTEILYTLGMSNGQLGVIATLNPDAADEFVIAPGAVTFWPVPWTDVKCPDEQVVVVPAAPEFINPCGKKNDEVILPEQEGVRYETYWIGNLVGVVASDADPNDNIVLDANAQHIWNFQFVGKKCPVEPPVIEPPVVEPPVDEPPVNEPPRDTPNPDEPKVTPDVPTAVDAGLAPVAAEANDDNGAPLLWIVLGVVVLGLALLVYIRS